MTAAMIAVSYTAAVRVANAYRQRWPTVASGAHVRFACRSAALNSDAATDRSDRLASPCGRRDVPTSPYPSTECDASREAPLSASFRRFLWTRLLGTAANQMLLVALAWQMYDLTGRAWDLGMVGLMQFLPALLLTLPAGQLVDRVDRRGVLAASLVLQALVAIVLMWASLLRFVGPRPDFRRQRAAGRGARAADAVRSRRSFPRWCRRINCRARSR